MLLAAYDVRRPTADVDIAAHDTPGEVDHIRDMVTAIAALPAEDGIVFDTSIVRAEQIRDEDTYAGVRVSLMATLATAVIRFHVDVNIGDPIWPQPESVQLSRPLGGAITLWGYPLAMLLAEKIITAMERGTANTRWRDFADIYMLTGAHALQADVVRKALEVVAQHRSVQLRPLRDVHDNYANLGQSKWAAWRRKQQLDAIVPELFNDVLEALWVFADPLVEHNTDNREWRIDSRQWE